MDLQVREQEIFETLRKLRNCNFVIIGGYAVNAYTLPRFSVDCDLVVKDDVEKVKKILVGLGYIKRGNSSYNFERFEKEIRTNFIVSMDLLFKEVVDRQTNVIFNVDWIFNHSTIRVLKGKTITKELSLRIIDLDALFIMKFISSRSTDIRDIFMLAPYLHNTEWVHKEISQRYSFKDRFSIIKKKINSSQFKDGLQGVYGYLDEKVFEKHRQALLNLDHTNS